MHLEQMCLTLIHQQRYDRWQRRPAPGVDISGEARSSNGGGLMHVLAVSKNFVWLCVVAEEGLSLLWTGAGATVQLDEMMESNGSLC